MLNQRPIFIVGFARGGSNILLNILRSHPGVCSPRGETQEVFRAKATESPATRLAKRLRYLPILAAERYDVFNIRLWEPRRSFRGISRRCIDRILFDEKLRARGASQNLFKSEGVQYTREEIAGSRLLCKNLNGLIYLTPPLAEMYPDATFVALVRNGLAVVEGHIRRGHDLDQFSARFASGCEALLEHANTVENFHLLRYEDLIADPQTALHRIYALAGLDAADVCRIRLETKQVIGRDGAHEYVGGVAKKRIKWYDIDDFGRHFVSDANENQIRRLDDRQRAVILSHCGPSMERLGYTSRDFSV